jgi:hypothetical protein
LGHKSGKFALAGKAEFLENSLESGAHLPLPNAEHSSRFARRSAGPENSREGRFGRRPSQKPQQAADVFVDGAPIPVQPTEKIDISSRFRCEPRMHRPGCRPIRMQRSFLGGAPKQMECPGSASVSQRVGDGNRLLSRAEAMPKRAALTASNSIKRYGRRRYP